MKNIKTVLSGLPASPEITASGLGLRLELELLLRRQGCQAEAQPSDTVSGLGLGRSGLCWSWPSAVRAARLWPRPGYSKSLMSGWGVQIWTPQSMKTLRFF